MVAMAPDANEQVIDLHALDSKKLKQFSKQEQFEYVKSIPTHRVEGIERITYWFSHPQWLTAYWPAVLTWFVFFFASTMFVSFLNTRDRK